MPVTAQAGNGGQRVLVAVRPCLAGPLQLPVWPFVPDALPPVALPPGSFGTCGRSSRFCAGEGWSGCDLALFRLGPAFGVAALGSVSPCAIVKTETLHNAANVQLISVLFMAIPGVN
jgi:hypothetical protein